MNKPIIVTLFLKEGDQEIHVPRVPVAGDMITTDETNWIVKKVYMTGFDSEKNEYFDFNKSSAASLVVEKE